MTLEDSRKSLFVQELINSKSNKKEWDRLILNTTGLSKFINLLSFCNVNDSIWNIIMEYVQISFPIIKHWYCSEVLTDDFGYYKQCYTCLTFSQLILIGHTVIGGGRYYCSMICGSCINRRISSGLGDKKKVYKMLTAIGDEPKRIGNLIREYRDKLAWLGFIDFDYVACESSNQN